MRRIKEILVFRSLFFNLLVALPVAMAVTWWVSGELFYEIPTRSLFWTVIGSSVGAALVSRVLHGYANTSSQPHPPAPALSGRRSAVVGA